mgnify:CR=1 FL=1
MLSLNDQFTYCLSMPFVTGTLIDNTPFKKVISKKTKKIDCSKQPTLEVKTIDLSAVAAAPNLELFSFGPNCIEEVDLNHLNICKNLNDIYIKVGKSVNLSPLASSSASVLHVTFDYPPKKALPFFSPKVEQIDLSFLPSSVRSVRLHFKNASEINLASLPSSIKKLHIGGKVKNLDLRPLESLDLAHLSISDTSQKELLLPESGLENLELFALMRSEIETLWLDKLSTSLKLKTLNLAYTTWNQAFFYGLEELEHLHNVNIYDTKRAYIQDKYLEGHNKVKSSGIKRYFME